MVRGFGRMPARVSGNRVSIRFAGNSPAASLRALLRGPAIEQSENATSLIQAHLLAEVRGWDQEAEFDEGHARDPKTARAVPASALGCILGPAAAKRFLDRL
jgi:hypothetical protein